MNRTLQELSSLLIQIPGEKRPRLFLIGEDSFLAVNRWGMISCYSIDKTFSYNGNNLDRGEILEFFSRLEFMVNQFIAIYIKPTIIEDFYLLLDYIDFFTKIKLLNKWKLINNKEKNAIIELVQVRNGFAHSFMENGIFYKGINIHKNFKEFKKDLSEVWIYLSEEYKKYQPNIDELINSLKNN